MPLLQDALKEFQPLYDEIQDCEWQLIYEFSTNADDKPEIADKVKSFLSSKLSALLEENKKLKKELGEANQLASKYARVISMVYDGEDVERAEKIVGLS